MERENRELYHSHMYLNPYTDDIALSNIPHLRAIEDARHNKSTFFSLIERNLVRDMERYAFMIPKVYFLLKGQNASTPDTIVSIDGVGVDGVGMKPKHEYTTRVVTKPAYIYAWEHCLILYGTKMETEHSEKERQERRGRDGPGLTTTVGTITDILHRIPSNFDPAVRSIASQFANTLSQLVEPRDPEETFYISVYDTLAKCETLLYTGKGGCINVIGSDIIFMSTSGKKSFFYDLSSNRRASLENTCFMEHLQVIMAVDPFLMRFLTSPRGVGLSSMEVFQYERSGSDKIILPSLFSISPGGTSFVNSGERSIIIPFSTALMAGGNIFYKTRKRQEPFGTGPRRDTYAKTRTRRDSMSGTFINRRSLDPTGDPPLEIAVEPFELSFLSTSRLLKIYTPHIFLLSKVGRGCRMIIYDLELIYRRTVIMEVPLESVVGSVRGVPCVFN